MATVQTQYGANNKVCLSTVACLSHFRCLLIQQSSKVGVVLAQLAGNNLKVFSAAALKRPHSSMDLFSGIFLLRTKLSDLVCK